MGRRRQSDIDELLEAWARWCDSGGVVQGGGSSMLAKMIENKGLMLFGTGGGGQPIIDCIETKIEGVVMKMATQNSLRADVLRLEYCAGWPAVVKRRCLPGYDPKGMGQFENANVLGVSVRTYRRQLAAARELLASELAFRG